MFTDRETTGMTPTGDTDVDGTLSTGDSAETRRSAELDQLEAELVDGLPRLNGLAETGVFTPDQFVDEIVGPLNRVHAATSTASRLPKSLVQQSFKLIGFLICSAERHLQFNGRSKGTIWQRLPHIEHLMANLAASLGLPPNLSTAGYWLEDRGRKALTFTGTEGEKSFKRCVQVWDACCRVASDAIRPICTGEVSPDSNEALIALDRAAKCYEAIGSKYKELMPSPSAARVGLTLERFNKFRFYLVSYPVLGRKFTSANAANLQSNFSADVLSGVSDETYVSRITERLDYLNPEDRKVVLADVTLPSVVDQFLAGIELRRPELVTGEVTIIASQIARQNAGFQAALRSYKRLYRAICSLSGKHWGSIKTILIDPASKISADEKARMTVSVDRSVGDDGHERPESIFRMRKDNPVVNKLLDAFDVATHFDSTHVA